MTRTNTIKQVLRAIIQEITWYTVSPCISTIPLLGKIYIPDEIWISEPNTLETIFCATDYIYSWEYLKKWKYHASDDSKDLIFSVINQIATDYFEYFSSFDCIIPYPLGIDRYIFRWFNQSSEISKVLSVHLWISIFKWVYRLWSWKHQSRLSRMSRMSRSIHFLIRNKSYIAWKNILLVDDVLSTGKSSISLAKFLLNHWAKSVSLFVIARNESKFN
jgi:predicted amidophosphoribosyltransferase